MKFGYSRELFTDVNENDAKAITNLLSQKLINEKEAIIREELSKHKIDPLKSETFFISNTKQLTDMLRKKELDILALTQVDYYKIKDLNLVKPLFLSSSDVVNSFKLYLVVNEKSQIKGFNDLKNKRITLISKFSSLIKYWIYSNISNKSIINFEDYFSSTETLNKSSQVLLKVLFNQSDACILDESSFYLAAELNPQLKKQLKIITISPTYPRSIICIRYDYESEVLRKNIVDVLSDLHNKKDGQQILKLFNINKLVKFNNEIMGNLEVLMKNISKLENNKIEDSKTKTKKK